MDVASLTMYWMAMYALLERLLPLPLRLWLDKKLEALWLWLLSGSSAGLVRLKVPDRPDGGSGVNHLFRHALVYVASLDAALRSHKSLDVVRDDDEGPLSFHLPVGELLHDTFRGITVKWLRYRDEKPADARSYASSSSSSYLGAEMLMRSSGSRHRPTSSGGGSTDYFILEFPAAARSTIVPAYLEQVSRNALRIQHHNTQLKLYANSASFRGVAWESAPFSHPSTFDSLALDPVLHRQILDDLDGFCHNQELYRQLGRAWKRGYLLHGPPGTGKTSLIAAIANRLHFDIYDLELTNVHDNTELKSLLMGTTRKSIIVIEDIDCSFSFPDRSGSGGEDGAAAVQEVDAGSTAPAGGDGGKASDGAKQKSKAAEDANSPKLTLSGLLNFTDGLWSGCAEERIFIFTTNFKDRLDPALLRPGRMDMHILLSYCTAAVAMKLARNYLRGAVSPESHAELYQDLKDAADGRPHTVTPAAVAEMFISHQAAPPEAALEAAIQAFRKSADALAMGIVPTDPSLDPYKRKDRRSASSRRMRW
jgi:chaperone BCS1